MIPWGEVGRGSCPLYCPMYLENMKEMKRREGERERKGKREERKHNKGRIKNVMFNSKEEKPLKI